MTTRRFRYRFSADQFEQMADIGVFANAGHLELVNGYVVRAEPVTPRHTQCVNRTNKLFVLRFRDVAEVSVQKSVRIAPRYVPEPNLALFRRHPGLYAGHIPTVEDVLLLVEVGDTTAQLDLRRKLPRYGRGGVPELWLVDLQQDTITVCRSPVPDGFASMTVYRRSEVITPLAFPDRTVAVTEILGEA